MSQPRLGMLYMPDWKGRQTVGCEGPGPFQRRSCLQLQEPLKHPEAGRGCDVCQGGGQWSRDYKFGSRPLSLRNPGDISVKLPDVPRSHSRVRALNLNPAPHSWVPLSTSLKASEIPGL